MPTLSWMGKDKVVDYYRQVPYRILKRVPDKSVLDSHGSDCGNAIVHGENLEALKALLPFYEGQIDCIYIDPPYNTGNEKWIYNDNVNDPRIRKWIGEVVGKEGDDFSRHDKWLCMMYPRLQLLRRMLRPSGVIFISIGDDECSSLQNICNEIFGITCFKGDISWQKTYSPRNQSGGVPTEVEHILLYSKDKSWTPSRLERTEDMDALYSTPDGDSRPWTSSDAAAPGANDHRGMVYAIQHPITGELLYPTNGRHWANGQDQMLGYMNEWADYELRNINDQSRRAEICGCATDELEDVPAIMLVNDSARTYQKSLDRYNRGIWPHIFFTSHGKGGIRVKKYLETVEGKITTNLWLYKDVGHTDEASKELKELFGGRAVFPNPKPSRLIRRILQVSCPSDGIVLDAFAGSGTTAQAVLQENETNHCDRHFVLIEMGDYADSITAERARTVISGYTTNRKHEERLYEKKLTANNLKNCQRFYDEAKAVADAVPDGQFDKVEGPKMDGSSIVVNGITNKGEQVPAIDSGFTFYELGPKLFLDDGESVSSEEVIYWNFANLASGIDPSVSRSDVMRYVWYTETKRQYRDRTDEHPYLMGEVDRTVYYFAWEPESTTTLNFELLSGLPIRGETTVVYADRCVLDEATLDSMGVRFKQIPRQIARI